MGFKKGHKTRLGQRNYNWKGGRFISTEGYVKVKVGIGKYIYEHKHVFEEFYNCRILKWGLIHHKNHDKTDNRIENLEGMTRSQHVRLHKPRLM